MIIVNNKEFSPSSEQDKKELMGIIYAIKNDYDGKIYIGKSIKSFNKRYCNFWWKTTTNILLQRTLKNGKVEDFKVYILEYGITDNKILNEREKYYASELNTYCPNGYNIRECGEGGEYFGKEIKEKIRISTIRRKKTYFVKNTKTKEVIEIKNLKDWCKNNNIKENCLRNLLCGLILESQGFCLPKTNTIDLENKRMKIAKTYKVKKIETQEIIEFKNAALFCENQKLEENSFRCMLCGAHKTSQGFCLPETEIKDLVKKIHSSEKFLIPKKIHKIKNTSTGKIIEFNNISQFCRENGIERTSIRHALSGKTSASTIYTHPEIPKKYNIFVVKSSTNEIYIIKFGCIRKFCRIKNLNYDNFIYMIQTKQNINNWTLLEKRSVEL